MPTGHIPILQIKTKDGKWLPVNAIGGQVASKVLYNNAYPTVEQALDYLFENGTGGGGTGGASTAANVSYTNAALPNVANVKTALDELVPDSHNHNNKNILDKLSVSGGNLTYDGKEIGGGTLPNPYELQITVGNTAYLYDGSESVNIAVKPATQLITTAEENITLADNTEYRLTDVTTLNLSYPTGDFECWMRLTFAASGDITVTLPAGTGYIGTAPDFKNGETWELSFKDKILAAQKVGEGT